MRVHAGSNTLQRVNRENPMPVIERIEPWIAALISALLHVLMLLIL